MNNEYDDLSQLKIFSILGLCLTGRKSIIYNIHIYIHMLYYIYIYTHIPSFSSFFSCHNINLLKQCEIIKTFSTGGLINIFLLLPSRAIRNILLINNYKTSANGKSFHQVKD